MNSFRSLSPSSSIIIRFRQYFFDKIPLTKATEALRLIHAESGKGCMNMDHSRSVNGSISIDLSKMSALEKTSDTDINTDSTNNNSTNYNSTNCNSINYDSISNESISKGITMLETYEVISEAIRGGMGSVWKVHHSSWNVDLAMKRPQPKYFTEGSQGRKEVFIHECRAWINLGLHPNIVSCYYVREIGGVPTVFSEWMDNGSLEDRIRDRTLYSGTEDVVRRRLLDIAIQFARGLHYAHEAGGGLIHQDVKPANLLLTKGWDAKVADFGLARARTQFETRPDQPETNPDRKSDDLPERFRGYTPAYCSPEQALDEPLTPLTDIYSWAVSVMEMYLGGTPWTSGQRGRITGPLAGKSCREYFLSEKCFPLPAKLQTLLTECLCEDPAARPQDFADIEKKLIRIYEEETGSWYLRPEPRAASNTADSLNNLALSYLDLGQPREAEKAWEEALLADPEHVDARFNRELKLLRDGKKYDFEVMKDLERIPSVKSSGAAQAIALECRGSADPLPAFLNAGPATRNFFLKSAVPVGNDICFSGFNRNPYSGNRSVLGWFSREDSKELQCCKVQFDDKKEGLLCSALCLDGRHALQLMSDGVLRIYDYRDKTVQAQTEPIPALAADGKVLHYPRSWFSADGKTAVFLRKNMEDRTAVSFFVSVPELTLLTYLPLEFIGFMPDGRGLLRENGRALYVIRDFGSLQYRGAQSPDPQTGELQEIFRFDREPEKTAEYCGSKGVFLAYSRTGEDPYCFRLDADFRKSDLAPEAFERMHEILYCDNSQKLLCTKDRSERLYFWDMETRHCLYTVLPKAFYDERGHFLDEESGQLFLWIGPPIMSAKGFSRWQPLPLPSMPYESEKAKWRLSGIVSSEERITEDDKIAEGIRRFEESRKQDDISEMARIHTACLEIPGFGAGAAAVRMEDLLDRKAVKNSLRAVRSMGHAQKPAMSARKECLFCGGGELIASYTEEKPEEGIDLYRRDGTFLRSVSVPDTADRIAVRGNHILAFGKMLDLVRYDLSGMPLDPARPAPARFSPPALNNDEKYGPPQLLAVDPDGRHILFAINRPFDPFRRKRAVGYYHRNLRTGRDICLCGRYREDLRPGYLRDGSILFTMPTPDSPSSYTPVRLSPEDGSLMMVYQSLPADFITKWKEASALADREVDMWDPVEDYEPAPQQGFQSVVSISPDGDRFLVTSYYDDIREYRLLDPDGKLHGVWKTKDLHKPVLLPGGLCICSGFKELQIWDLKKQEVIFSEPAAADSDVFVYPDGRQIWRGGNLFRLEYDYRPVEEGESNEERK